MRSIKKPAAPLLPESVVVVTGWILATLDKMFKIDEFLNSLFEFIDETLLHKHASLAFVAFGQHPFVQLKTYKFINNKITTKYFKIKPIYLT